ncbi:MAG: glycosyltransferase [Planctomycetia bacterium]|nr:glycosyltransferase [Planctomycetia bacterium]
MALESLKKRKVLVLSASAGAGHVRAAEALEQICRMHSDVGEVQHWDMLKYTTRLFRHIYSQVYLDLINKAPRMLGWIYDTFDTPWRNEKMRMAFEKFNAGPFLKAAMAFQPDHIICTHFTPASLLGWLYEKGKIPVKPAIVVTDYDCHAMWLNRTYQHYFVLLDETREFLVQMGIDPARITMSGIPIDPVFMETKAREDVRRKLGLTENLFTILVAAGGYGVGPVEALLTQLLKISRPVQLVVIAGHGEELKQRLDHLAARQNRNATARVVPVGFTTVMDEYMAAADLLLGKPGGLTTSEAMARNLPLCIVNPIPGQEERNSAHLLEFGVAIRGNNLPTLAWKIQKLIDDPQRLARMRENTRQLAHPEAARTIVNTMLSWPLEIESEEAPLRYRFFTGHWAQKRLLRQHRRQSNKASPSEL